MFIFKDFRRTPVHINTIPVESLESVKDWMDSVNIPFSEGPLNLNWGVIMKTVTSDPHQFFVDGGWSVLGVDSDAEGSSDESEESAFEMSDSELAASDESSEEDSDFDEDASAAEDDDDDGDASGASADDDDISIADDSHDDKSGKKATKKDRPSGRDDGDRGRKRKR